jgi:hypothetical protein
MPAKSGSGDSRTRPFRRYQVLFDGFRIMSGPDPRGRLTEPQSLAVASIVSRRAGRCSAWHVAWVSIASAQCRRGQRCAYRLAGSVNLPAPACS